MAKMDARLIIQVIINIVDNAIKYTQEGSEIDITTAKSGGDIVVSIADNGKGIADDAKKESLICFILLIWKLLTVTEAWGWAWLYANLLLTPTAEKLPY